MTLDMWFKEDIGNVLMGLALATPRMGQDYPDGGAEFQAGYAAALTAVAVSFGIRNLPGLPQPEQRQPQLRIINQERRLTSGR